jgi:UDP-N-acetylglucosamine acyltransferase
MTIHKTAIVEDGAIIHDAAEIGPYVVIGPNVKIGAGTKVGAHSIIDGHTEIGENCHIFAGASLGLEPQDLKYKGEPTGVKIGDRVTIREYVTIHRGTGDRHTYIGDDCFFMNYVHIAHDCKVGKGVIITNNAGIAGHVEIGDYAVFSGYCIVHQNVRIGRSVMMGGMTGTRLDLPPFSLCDGRPASWRDINKVGLRRHGFSPELRQAIRMAYKMLYRQGLNISQAIARIQAEIEPYPEIKEITDFFQTSRRGVVPVYTDPLEGTVMEEMAVEAL